MSGKKRSKILILPPVCNCFILAMTNKLVVIMNSLKVPKIKKMLLYEMKFFVPNWSCLQKPWLRGYCPQIPVLSVLNWICWTPLPPNKITGYATDSRFLCFYLNIISMIYLVSDVMFIKNELNILTKYFILQFSSTLETLWWWIWFWRIPFNNLLFPCVQLPVFINMFIL